MYGHRRQALSTVTHTHDGAVHTTIPTVQSRKRTRPCVRCLPPFALAAVPGPRVPVDWPAAMSKRGMALRIQPEMSAVTPIEVTDNHVRALLVLNVQVRCGWRGDAVVGRVGHTHARVTQHCTGCADMCRWWVCRRAAALRLLQRRCVGRDDVTSGCRGVSTSRPLRVRGPDALCERQLTLSVAFAS